ncbi:hypothetical protein [Streptomyces griseoviridis]|uniref:Peptidoglycan binding domain-containing protein n=1 Tax=Streptomyces griseoviridis TaxID=45398 RepID=A0ABT9LL42_STRGD|nr:hypothetical protein [Streptomyces griseoviridis]MDP9683902.1 hypothetical protein [Streptomyces griseoviridis]GGS85888.1 hypothetical protein GCM10010240_19180 [Streptomyces griseoviridis]
MSRETDTPSSGPHGRGGAAYPSGTPPYGTPTGPDTGAGAGRPAARPDERKTETTLTTRIRINIPGSRPIPPVVVRKPVGEAEDGTPEPEAEAAAPEDARASARTAGAPAEPARPAAEKPTSDWFAPRKSPAPKGGPAGAPAKGAAPAAGPAGGPAPAPPPSGTGRPGGIVGAMNASGGSRPRSPGGTGPTGATGGPVAPGHGGGTGSFDVTEALAAGPLGDGPRPGTGPGSHTGQEPRRDDLPYFTEPGTGTGPGPGAGPGPGEARGHEDFTAPGGPAGPTGGPVTGDGPLTPPPSPASADTGTLPGVPGGGLSDDTAILTPQAQAPEPPAGGPFGHPDNVSGNTVTSGIPVVPGDRSVPFQNGAPVGGPTPQARPEPVTPAPAPAPAPAAPAKAAKPAKKKGRNKLVLLCGAVIFVGGVAYGAGLLMNHSDVPKGTTVLGVDIGGGTRDDAVEKLDAAFDDRVNKELKLTVDGDTVALKPDQAGLQFDVQATVDVAAHSDYNPVTVIASLFGNHRVVDPVMPVDEEKLQAALERAAGGSGSMAEGGIEFKSGAAVPVYPKAGKGIDADRSADAVAEAYRTQVGTGTSAAVKVPTTARQPQVTKAEVDREMKEFAEPAMSANVVVRTDAAHTIEMSPQKSLWKFLRVTAVDGKLVDKPDLDALQELYGQTFDGVLITRASGEKTAVTPQDVYGALRQALLSTTDRVAVIDTDPS